MHNFNPLGNAAMNDKTQPPGNETLAESTNASVRRFEDLPPAAQRALTEAKARQATYENAASALKGETGGRGGKEPVRYGDYEVKGIAVDF